MVVQFLEAENFLFLDNVIDSYPAIFHLWFKLKADREQEIKCHKVVYDRITAQVQAQFSNIKTHLCFMYSSYASWATWRIHTA